MKQAITCPNCGHTVETYKNPVPTVDVIIEYKGGIVLILRKNPPPGWAIPGGFVDYGETVESAAVREAKEETNLDVADLRLLSVYSEPDRDPRMHTITTVFVARGDGMLKEGDDAAGARVFPHDYPPDQLAFDHERILEDYWSWKLNQEKKA